MSDLIGSTILLVEDNALIAIDLQETLADLGADVVLAQSVEQAEQEFNRHFDLAILDVMLGEETSLPLMKQLAADGTPMLLISGLATVHAIKVQFDRCIALEKPVTMAMVRDNVLSLLGPVNNMGETG